MIEKFWKAALKVSPVVAIVGFLLWGLMHFMFQEQIISLFNTEQKFVLILIFLLGLIICLFAAVVTHRSKEKVGIAPTNNKIEINKSTIKGDVFLGDKHEGRK